MNKENKMLEISFQVQDSKLENGEWIRYDNPNFGTTGKVDFKTNTLHTTYKGKPEQFHISMLTPAKFSDLRITFVMEIPIVKPCKDGSSEIVNIEKSFNIFADVVV